MSGCKPLMTFSQIAKGERISVQITAGCHCIF